ncbi:MAG: hypothetical protein E7211_16865 [Clostridium lundense]|nr:hypothetical protein [Clostridium lundense]
MSNNKLYEKILDMFDEYYKDREDKDDVDMPGLYYVDEISKKKVLFIGINPSFNKEAIKKVLKDSSYKDIDVESYFKLGNRENVDLEIYNFIGRRLKKSMDYFKRCGELAKHIELEDDWQSVDLFYMSEVEQEKVKKHIYGKKKVLTKFAIEQLKITKEAIKKANPEIIIVINALASDIIKGNFEVSEFDESIGTYIININDKKVPILFSSMLSGQRALDKGSFERLKWHCKMIVNGNFTVKNE